MTHPFQGSEGFSDHPLPQPISLFFLTLLYDIFMALSIHLFILAVLGLSCSMWDILVAACGLLVVACMRDLVPRPGIERSPPALGAQSLTHWTTTEVPTLSEVTFFICPLVYCLFLPLGHQLRGGGEYMPSHDLSEQCLDRVGDP